MKTVISPHPNARLRVATAGGHVECVFTNYEYTGPNNVADSIVAMYSNYRLKSPSTVGLDPGTKLGITRDMGIGDVLMLTPSIRKLHRAGVKVTFFTRPQHVPLFNGNPYVEGVYSEDRRKAMLPGLVLHIGLNGTVEQIESRTAGAVDHRVRLFARQLDFDLDASEMHLDYFVTSAEKKWALDQLAPLHKHRMTPKGIIAYVWSSTNLLRNWDSHQHARIIAALVDAGYGLAFISSNKVPYSVPKDWPIVDFSAKTSIREGIALMDSCTACLTPDTGMFHAAGAIDLPTVGYFGTKPYEEFQTHTYGEGLTYRAQSTADPKFCGLLPCRRYHQATPGCMHPQRTTERMPPCIALDADQILAAIGRVIAKKAAVA
jgi:ADP-heptose:LPS heptosyltransferase